MEHGQSREPGAACVRPEAYGGALAPLSSGDWMAAAVSCIPSALLDGAGAQRLIRCARALPAAAGDDVFLFEFRLGEPEPAADLSLWAVPHTAFADWLVARGDAEGASPASRGLARYLREIGRPDSFLGRWLAYAMLEYDLAGAHGENLPTPGVFLGSRIRKPADAPDPASVRWRHGNPGLMTAAICLAAGWEENDRDRRHVQLLCDLLPRLAYSAQLGAMPGREPRAIRLISRLPASEVPDYLARAGWPGPADLATEVAAEAASFDLKVSLALDVNESGVLPRIGFELYVADGWKSPPPLWNPFLKRLLALDICLPEKETGLRRWPRRELLFLADGARRLLSGLNHIKLVISDGRLSAKAYTMMKLLPVQ